MARRFGFGWKDTIIAACVALLSGSTVLAGIAAADFDPEYTSEFRAQDCRFRSYGGNRFFPLTPGFHSRLEGEDEEEDESVILEIDVLHQTQWLRLHLGGRHRWVRTRVLRETEFINGELFEVSRNFFARCANTGDIYYFGEDVDFYEDGEIVGHGGSWRAGVDGAKPGIIMPGTFLLGARYYQELAPGVGEDQGEHTAMGLEVETEAGTQTGCVEVTDTDGLEPEAEGDVKIYCPGIGLTVDEDLELVEFGYGD